MKILNVTGGMFNGLLDKVASPTINDDVVSTALIMVGVAIGIASICFLIQVAIELGKRFTGASNEGFSFLPKYAVMALALILYVPLMKIVDTAMCIPTMAMQAAGAKNALQIKQAREAAEKANIAKQDDGSFLEMARKASNVAASATSAINPNEWSKIFLNSLIQWIADLIDMVVFLIRQYLLNVMFVCGPLALAFSFIKNMEGSFMSFFKYYIVIHMWALIAFVLDNIYSAITISGIQEESAWFNSGNPSYDALVYKCGFIILHCMIPKLADMLISGSQGGAFFSAASGMVVKGMSMVGQAAGAVATGGSSVAATAAAKAGSSGGSSLTGTKV